MQIEQNKHFVDLNKSYKKVADQTLKNQDLLPDNLKISRDLFTEDSLESRTPVPKDLEVFALLSGLSFEHQFTDKLVSIQNAISDIIEETLHYWVKPENFGVEYCVFKWPWGEWDESWLPLIQNKLSTQNTNGFNFTVKGIQINPDGCVIAKGFDEGAQIFSMRKNLKNAIDFLPEKQSAWAHIPIGRILEPLGEHRFAKLMQYFNNMSDQYIASQQIASLKLIHETRWYMEKHEVIGEYTVS